MRKFIIISALSLSLAGCAGGTAVFLQTLNDGIALFNKYTAKICSFQADFRVGADIVAKFFVNGPPVASALESGAQALCDRLSPPAPAGALRALRARGPVVFNGVAVHGTFADGRRI